MGQSMELKLREHSLPTFTNLTKDELQFIFFQLQFGGSYNIETLTSEKDIILFDQTVQSMQICKTTNNRYIVRNNWTSLYPELMTVYLVNSNSVSKENDFVSVFATSRHPTEHVYPIILPYDFTLSFDEVKQLIIGIFHEKSLSNLSLTWKSLPKWLITMNFDDQSKIDKELLVSEIYSAPPNLMWRFGSKVGYGCEPIWNPGQDTIIQWIDEADDDHPYIEFIREISGHTFSLDCYSDNKHLNIQIHRSPKDPLWRYDYSLAFHHVTLVPPTYNSDLNILLDTWDELPTAQFVLLGDEELPENASIIGKGFGAITVPNELMVDPSLAKEVIIDFMIHGRLRDDLRWITWSGDDTSIFEL